jgi:hypothetical protein
MYTQRKTTETVCVDISEELKTRCRGMERPGNEITHLGGTPIDVEKVQCVSIPLHIRQNKL